MPYSCTLFYVLITCRVSHAFSWKFLKPHMFAIVQDVLFPILSYSQADEELWNTDPYEYIRVKFGKNISCVLLPFTSLIYVCMYLCVCPLPHVCALGPVEGEVQSCHIKCTAVLCHHICSERGSLKEG